MSQPPQDQSASKSPDALMREDGLTPFQVMLHSAPPDYLTNLEDAVTEAPSKYPIYYFFYGTLTSPTTLRRILDKPEEPSLRKAQIIGYALAKWGDHPALIDGEQGQAVSGQAYLVHSEEEAQKLAYYETNAYKVASCCVFFTDDGEPAEAPGRTFMYAGDAKALLEQRFDRKLWNLQMAGKLG